jgi:hypothetical protein
MKFFAKILKKMKNAKCEMRNEEENEKCGITETVKVLF